MVLVASYLVKQGQLVISVVVRVHFHFNRGKEWEWIFVSSHCFINKGWRSFCLFSGSRFQAFHLKMYDQGRKRIERIVNHGNGTHAFLIISVLSPIYSKCRAQFSSSLSFRNWWKYVSISTLLYGLPCCSSLWFSTYFDHANFHLHFRVSDKTEVLYLLDTFVILLLETF